VPKSVVLPTTRSLAEHRQLLNDLHHEISNHGPGRTSDLFRDAFEALLGLTLEYLTPDFDPEYEIEIRRKA
jgi:hypothetical protein